MLVIKVELWPYGDEKNKEVIGTGVIVNDGSGSAQVGNYDVLFVDQDVPDAVGLYQLNAQKSVGVRNHLRAVHSVWKLVHNALDNWLWTYGIGK